MQPTVMVELGSRSYPIHIGPGMIGRLGQAVTELGKVRSAVIVTDSNVLPLYGPAALRSIEQAGIDASLISLPAGEENKNLATMGHLFDELFAAVPAVDRDTLIVALGGGVAGDMAGFMAATALRGLRFIQAPTTLLAQVDSSVGGKTGVDHPAGKNLIGCFYQPSAVLIDVETLRTLPPLQLQSGLGECVKHAMIRDESLLEFIESNIDAIACCDSEVMSELVTRNVKIKAAVVAADERERNVRAHLNFGHTIGHGVEAAAGYGAMTHGQAVALGMVAATFISVRRGLVAETLLHRLEEILRRLGLKVRWPGLRAERVQQIMKHDKKVLAGRTRMVLPTGSGQIEIFDDTPAGLIDEAIRYVTQE